MTDHSPVAIVTASSGGIGAAVAEELQQRGYKLVLFASSERIRVTAERLGVPAVQGSLASPKDLERLTAEAITRYGRIDALVNNSGRPGGGDVLAITDAEWLVGFEM